MANGALSPSQESLDLHVETDLITAVKCLTELSECIRRAVRESDDARSRAERMGLSEIIRELDMGRLRLTRARQVLDGLLAECE